MANAASATCAWSETSEEGLDGPAAPRGWSAGIFEWVFERLERQERSGAIGRVARKKDATVFRDGPESTRSTSARERRRVRRLESRVRPEKKKNTGIAFARWVRGEARVLDASGTARVSSRVATPRVRASLYLVAGTRARAPSPRVALVLCGVRVPTAPGAALAFPARDDGGTFFMCCSACSAISSSAFPRGDCTGGC